MLRLLVTIATILIISTVAAGEIRYVDRSAPQNGDGVTWATAYRSLRGACNEAASNAKITEIWVAANEYNTNGESFVLSDDLQIYGGFVGGETERNQRDPFLNPTYIDAEGSSEIFHQGNFDNLYFDGLIFRNAIAGNQAGAVLCGYTVSATFVNCKFNNNYSSGGTNLPPNGGGGAVGIYEAPGGLRFINCVFRNNRAWGRGGAVNLYTGPLEFMGCLFVENRSLNREGGAFYTYESETLVNMCTFWGNESAGTGGAIDNYRATLTIVNSILWDNRGDCGLVTGCPIGIEIYYWPPEGTPDIQSSITPLGDFIDSFRHFRSNPLLINAPGDLMPFALSPAVDAGDNTRVPADIYDLDRDGDLQERHPIDCLGNPRFIDAGPAEDTGIFDGTTPGPICDMGAVEFQDDCNGNGVPDLKDTASGSSEDCDGNGLPDECELDCDGDGVVDACAVADGLVPDCNGNLIPDGCDVAADPGSDLDANGIPDSCEDCNNNRLPDGLDVLNSGDSEDCNADGVPDECQLGIDDVRPYDAHDGEAESGIGTGQQGWIFWAQGFEADEYRSAIRRVGIDFVGQTANTRARVMVLSDPNGDGNPNDAEVLRQRNISIQQPNATAQQFVNFNPPVQLNPEEKFFIGVYMVLSESWFPAAFDDSIGSAASWVGFDPEAFEISELDSIALLTNLPSAGIQGVWAITGVPVYAGGENDCNENGVPDDCDIASGDSTDVNLDGILDECQELCLCDQDLDRNGQVDGADLGLLFTQWGGPGSADFNLDGSVDGEDLGLLFVAWGPCQTECGPFACGDAEAGTCSEPGSTPFCSDAACCELVCEVDDFCCTDIWDESCVELAGEFCP